MRAAIRAKHLCSVVTAFCCFDISLWRARQEGEVLLLCDDTNAKCTARKFLAIGTMANATAFRVNRCFVCDGTALTTAIDFHDPTL